MMMGMDISVKEEKTEGSKFLGPLFPRLHVNDIKKTGTRAPPRNKMALYNYDEQRPSVSSQKFNTPASTLPANGRMHTNMSPSTSSQCVIGTKRSMFSPYKNSSASSHPNGRQIVHSTERISDNMTGNFINMSMLTTSNGNVNAAESPLPKLQLSTLEPCNRAQFKPTQDAAATFVLPRLNSSSSVKDLTSFDESCSLELQTNTAPKVNSFTSNDLELQHHVRMLNDDGGLEKKACRGDASNEEPEMSIVTNDSVMRSKSCHASAIASVDHQTLKVEDDNHHLEVLDHSNASVKECVSRSIINSEAVTKMIGQEEFQKARNTIIQQQRVFSMQVIELHRLIRVQKLIAGYGNVQHKECPPIAKLIHEPISMDNSSPKSIPKAPSWNYKSRNGFMAKKSAINEKPKPLPLQLSLSSDTAILAKSEQDFDKHTNSFIPPMWYLSPQENQWLLPMVSPSEGLIYKPYPNPPPPPPSGDLAAYGINGSTPPMRPTYFGPYGMNILNPCASTTDLNQMTSSINFDVVHQSSCNMSEAKDGGINKRGLCDTLPLFPTAPTTLNREEDIKSHGNDQKIQVIKVIPHNPMLASESAARIVKSIQEERKTLM